MRIALTSDWEFEGIEGLLTQYRINCGGLSAATDRQLAAWERMVEKLYSLSPDFFDVQAPIAQAYQLRYLSRRAISDLDGPRARVLTRDWIKTSLIPLREEPIKSVVTIAAAAVLAVFGARVLRRAMAFAAGSARAEAVQ